MLTAAEHDSPWVKVSAKEVGASRASQPLKLGSQKRTRDSRSFSYPKGLCKRKHWKVIFPSIEYYWCRYPHTWAIIFIMSIMFISCLIICIFMFSAGFSTSFKCCPTASQTIKHIHDICFSWGTRLPVVCHMVVSSHPSHFTTVSLSHPS